MPADTPSVIIKGIGAYVPAHVVTNDELSKTIETSDEWIRTRSGIGERRFAAPDEATSDLAVKAARAALEDAGVCAAEIDLIIVATMSPDMPFPSTACIVQGKLGAGCLAAFDITAACSGFLYALDAGSRMMQSGHYRNALIIGAEKMTSILDWDDRATCVLFGDGAGAVVLSAGSEPGTGVIDSLLRADGGRHEREQQTHGEAWLDHRVGACCVRRAARDSSGDQVIRENPASRGTDEGLINKNSTHLFTKWQPC